MMHYLQKEPRRLRALLKQLRLLDGAALKRLRRQMEPLGFYKVLSNWKTFYFIDCQTVSFATFCYQSHLGKQEGTKTKQSIKSRC